MAVLKLENVQNTILSSIFLTLEKGETIAVQGPSGAGKSTLLKVIAGLVPANGNILINNKNMQGICPQSRNIGYLSQDLHLFPHLSVRANLGLALLFSSIPRPKRRDLIEQTLALCAIDHRAGRRPNQLSGGERQRAALARALVRRPTLLLLDEPFSALDSETKHILWRDFIKLRYDLSLSALIVTHDVTEACTLANNHIFLCDGRLQTGRKNNVSG